MYRKRYIATGSSTTQYGVQCTIQHDRTVTNVFSLHIFGQKNNMYRVKPGLGPLLLSQHRPQTLFRGKEILDCPIIALRSTFWVWSNIILFFYEHNKMLNWKEVPTPPHHYHHHGKKKGKRKKLIIGGFFISRYNSWIGREYSVGRLSKQKNYKTTGHETLFTIINIMYIMQILINLVYRTLGKYARSGYTVNFSTKKV